MRILIVEDERKIASFLSRGLSEEGHVPTAVEDLAQARQQLEQERYDLLIVDRMLPDGDGLTLIRELRRHKDDTPAICLTARDRVEERVEGLSGGADDYLLKPFAFAELLARIGAVTRRRSGGERVEIADLVIDRAAHRVSRAGKELQLSPKEYELLCTLAEHRGRVLSRTRLLEQVWDTTHDPGTNVVDVYISYLRARIDKDFDPPLIHTVRGYGYVLEDRPR